MLPYPFYLRGVAALWCFCISCIELDVFKVLDKLLYLGWERDMAELRAGNRRHREACWLYQMASVTNQTKQQSKAFALMDLDHQNGLLWVSLSSGQG